MKYFFIEISKDLEYKIPSEIKNKKVGIVVSIQFLNSVDKIKKEFPSWIFGGQVVGCNASNALKLNSKVDCYYVLSEGRFHAIEIARKTGKEVYVATGEKISSSEIVDYERKLTGRKMRYYNSDKIGILVSLKPGQYNFKLALDIKKKLNSEGKKKAYIFMEDNIDVAGLENFTGVDMFINTACSRIEANNIINYEDII